MYKIIFAAQVKEDIAKLKRNEPSAHKKAIQLLNELMDHPKTGTGHPEQLKGDRSGQWSRQITKKHRLVYEIHDDVIEVLVLSSYGHYGDK